MNPKSINPSSLAQYIKLENCDRFLRFRVNPEDQKIMLKKWGLTIQPLTPLLEEMGTEFEKDVESQIAAEGEVVVKLGGRLVDDTLSILKNIHEPTILLQPFLESSLGNYACSGNADAIRVQPDRNGNLKLLIADIKASRQERTDHRLQIAVYANMLQQMLTNKGIGISEINGAVLTLQDNEGIPHLNKTTPIFDLDTYLTIVDRLAVIPNCKLDQIANQPFHEVFYHLNYKCDGCLYNAICMYDSAERMDITLTPAITAVEKRVLNEIGITSLTELANLMIYPSEGSQKMEPNPEFEDKLGLLQNRWPVAPNLPFLVQRAKAALKVFNDETESRPYILGSGFGTLPSDDEHPGLIKIFIDAQHDYVKNRLYLLSGLVVGPNGSKEIIKITKSPPTEDDERDLLRDWILDTLTAIRDSASSGQAPIHIYCYNRYDQKVLLEALKRHLDDVSTIPGFFDLLTQSPALSQSIISFLYDELRERTNLGLTCLPLHDAARRLGFDWKDDNYEYFTLFRARMFDNRRTVTRNENGNLENIDHNNPILNSQRIRIESASRFNSQIPLEYAYAAWKELPEIKEERRILEPFKAVDIKALMSFAVMRTRALRDIEGRFRIKGRNINKPLLFLPEINQEVFQGDLRMALEEFLFMEHHASLQEHLLHYSLPVERRVQSGKAMLLRYLRQEDSNLHLFSPEFSSIGLDQELTMNACKIKEGDWVVMNDPTDPQLTATKIKNGRLAIISELNPSRVVLEFRDNVQGWNKLFRYNHDRNIRTQPGKVYVLDEMVDDINADKVLESIRNINTNVFYHWLTHHPESVSNFNKNFYEQFIEQVNTLLSNRRWKLTGSQRDMIGKTPEYPIALIQGPPGTGKSYTLAWTILARIASASNQGKSCRVAVCCKTHKAIRVVLKALDEAAHQLAGFGISHLGREAFSSLKIYKIDREEDIHDLPRVNLLDPYEDRENLPTILNMPFFIIGATTGGLYNLMRYSSGRQVDWSSKFFDLIFIDEASQMSIPEGVLAGAFLKRNGQMIVVGDHRQMPPIIAHRWKDEQKRNIAEMKPFLSLFEALEERGFPKMALDESFRLHEDIAKFLEKNIYSKDGIKFHSKRKKLLSSIPPINDYVNAVMDPQYPIVVIEHTESGSQQFNQKEIELTEPIIDACVRYLRLDGQNGVGVVVPHRAQKAMLCQKFAALAGANSIDTVERFQGDERDVIIVSATASDPDYVRYEADFLVNLNRLNVAISRPRYKLIVIASRSVVDLLTSDLDIFENSVLWKRLFYHYTPDLLYQEKQNGIEITVKGRRCNS